GRPGGRGRPPAVFGAPSIAQPRPLAPRRERRSASHLATAGRIADRAVLAAVPLRGSSPRGGAAAWVEPARQGTSKLDTPGRRHPLPDIDRWRTRSGEWSGASLGLA